MHRQGFTSEVFPERGWRSCSSLPFPETWQLLNSCHQPQQTMSKASPGPAAALGVRERTSCGELAGDQEAAQTAAVTDPLLTAASPGLALSCPKGLASCSRGGLPEGFSKASLEGQDQPACHTPPEWGQSHSNSAASLSFRWHHAEPTLFPGMKALLVMLGPASPTQPYTTLSCPSLGLVFLHDTE